MIYGLAVASGMTRKQDGGSNQCNQSSATTAGQNLTTIDQNPPTTDQDLTTTDQNPATVDQNPPTRPVGSKF